MEHNCNYNKVELLARVSDLIWVIEKHYIQDAKKEGHPLCAAAYQEIADDLKKHRKKLTEAIVGLAKEGKFK
ncbi:MAG: hypothetical protein QW331_02170 [Candidatus Woesearchaeota archaeon]